MRFFMTFEGPFEPIPSIDPYGPALAPQITRSGQFIDQDLLRRARRLQPEAALLFSEPFSDVSFEGAAGRFTPNNDMAAGRTESAHGVRFGQLMLSSAANQGSVELVAVKPFDEPEEAVHELGTMHYLNSQRSNGHIRPLSFQPLGIYREADGSYSAITTYDHAVITFDTLYWQDRDVLTPQRIEHSLSRCAFGIGALHNLGAAHGDAQAKNLASDNRGIRIVDVETTTAYDPANVDETKELMARDLQAFGESLYSRAEDEADEAARRNAIAPYVGRFAHDYSLTTSIPSSRIPKGARLQVDEITEIILG